MLNVEKLGQVFTPQPIVSIMLQLRKVNGTVLEPSCGDGAILNKLANAVGIEIDKEICPKNAFNTDFFDYPIDNKFDTIIGNPPYVRYQDILPSTKKKLNLKLFDERSNLYLFFIEKSLRHLNDNGEIIFITPRDFLKATSAIKLNNLLYQNGTITDIIELGDQKVFNGYSPNTIIWRYEKDNFSRKTNYIKQFLYNNGQLLFTDNHYPVKFSDVFFVKVGAVSGLDSVFENDEFGNADFVSSSTRKTGITKRMLYNQYHPYLDKFKDQLLKRRIKKFDESNWWQWGRLHYQSDLKRIYVNTKTRNKKPFFLNDSTYYDGSILAIFPKNQSIDLQDVCNELNAVNWGELGFVCDGRYLFSQKSLENSILPKEFLKYIINTNI